MNLINEYNIKNFKGVFMRDNLPKTLNSAECAIVNLDSIKNEGTHWVCYWIDQDNKYYFDSFGLYPPDEIKSYLGKNILTSTYQVQEFSTNYCGYLCLHVLSCLSNNLKFENIILNLFKNFNTIK